MVQCVAMQYSAVQCYNLVCINLSCASTWIILKVRRNVGSFYLTQLNKESKRRLTLMCHLEFSFVGNIGKLERLV